jgi:hypothetical protein
MCGKMFENPSQLIPHGVEEGIELLWSIDLDMSDVFRGIRDVEPFRLRQVED